MLNLSHVKCKTDMHTEFNGRSVGITTTWIEVQTFPAEREDIILPFASSRSIMYLASLYLSSTFPNGKVAGM
jgi:hypothetical protein